MTYDAFMKELDNALKNKPKNWRDGQTIFNYIDEKYGVARHVQFVERIDCFYDDGMIIPFILKSFEVIKNNL